MLTLGKNMIAIILVGLTALEGKAAAPLHGERPLVLTHYYTWYTTGFGRHGGWNAWGKKTPSEFYPQGCDPEKIIFSPSIRQISSCAYPLIGPYDSDNREVVRWHIRLAKAAGIDGFFVDWWGMAQWQKPKGYTRMVFEEVVMPVAQEEGFKVCFFDETPQFYKHQDEVITWATEFLNKYKNSPAYLKIKGEPVYGVYQLWKGRLSPEEGRSLIREVEAHVGPVYWIFDRVQAQPSNEPEKQKLRVAPGWLEMSEIDAICMYSTFSSIRIYDGQELARLYRGLAEEVHAAGKALMLPAHPGMDNRKIQIDEVARREGKPHWYIPRCGDQTLRDYLQACVQADTDFICITSFNEWPETTAIEPALTWPDPYLYLKTIAEFTKHEWQTPPLPPESALDPVMRPFMAVAGRSAD